MSKPQRVVAAGLAPAKPVYGRGGIRHGGGLSLPRGGRAERGNLGLRCERRSRKWKNHEGESTEAELDRKSTRLNSGPPRRSFDLRWPELAERRSSGTWEPGTPMRTEKPQVEEPRGREYGSGARSEEHTSELRSSTTFFRSKVA